MIDSALNRIKKILGKAPTPVAADPDAGMSTVEIGGTWPIQVGEMQQDAVDEAHAAAIEAKRQADETRAFVLEHQEKLRGRVMPVEIYSVQNLVSHSCLIVNDYLLLSYVEAEQLIRQVFNLVEDAKSETVQGVDG